MDIGGSTAHGPPEPMTPPTLSFGPCGAETLSGGGAPRPSPWLGPPSIPSITPASPCPPKVSGELLIPSDTPVTTRAVKPILSTATSANFHSHKNSGKSSVLWISATFSTVLRPTQVSGVLLIPSDTPVTSIANEASVSSNTLVSVLIDTEVSLSIDTTWGSGFLITLIGGPKV